MYLLKLKTDTNKILEMEDLKSSTRVKEEQRYGRQREKYNSTPKVTKEG